MHSNEALQAGERWHRRVRSYVTAVSKRFFEIGGIDQSGLLALELFTTVIPLMLIGFAYAKHFSGSANVGTMIVKQLNVGPPQDQTVIAAFGDASDMKAVWSVLGLGSFLFWGIPMSLTVSSTFRMAWKHPPIPMLKRIGRGTLWFVLYLLTMSIGQKLFGSPKGHDRPIRFLLTQLPNFVFWTLTPLLLVQGSAINRSRLVWAGVWGTLIDGIVLRIAGRIVLPMLLSGWEGFGPIGVAMTLMTWCVVMGTGWVLTACAGAVAVEGSSTERHPEFT